MVLIHGAQPLLRHRLQARLRRRPPWVFLVHLCRLSIAPVNTNPISRQPQSILRLYKHFLSAPPSSLPSANNKTNLSDSQQRHVLIVGNIGGPSIDFSYSRVQFTIDSTTGYLFGNGHAVRTDYDALIYLYDNTQYPTFDRVVCNRATSYLGGRLSCNSEHGIASTTFKALVGSNLAFAELDFPVCSRNTAVLDWVVDAPVSKWSGRACGRAKRFQMYRLRDIWVLIYVWYKSFAQGLFRPTSATRLDRLGVNSPGTSSYPEPIPLWYSPLWLSVLVASWAENRSCCLASETVVILTILNLLLS